MRKSVFLAIIATLSMLIVLMMFIWFVRISVNFDSLEEQSIETPDLSGFPDGTYRGFYEVFPLSVTVDIVIMDEDIKSIEIFNHSLFFDMQVEEVFDGIILNQHLDLEISEDYKYSELIFLLAIMDAIAIDHIIEETT